jgi:hypothetical protein
VHEYERFSDHRTGLLLVARIRTRLFISALAGEDDHRGGQMMGSEAGRSPDQAEDRQELSTRLLKTTRKIAEVYRQVKYEHPKGQFVLHLALSEVVMFAICAYDAGDREIWPDQTNFIEYLPVEWDEKLGQGYFLVLPLNLSKRRVKMLEREAIERDKNR